MERVISTRGLLTLPPKPQLRSYLPLHTLRSRLPSAAAPVLCARAPASALHGLSCRETTPSIARPTASRDPERSLLYAGTWGKQRKVPIFRAGAAIPADGAGSAELGEKKPNFLGVEITTLKKIVPLGIMFFCILFNYTILRDTKDVLVVTAKGSSAEIIPFLKTWVNLPMAVGFMLLYTKLSNVLSKEALFYTVILPFIAFFGAFAFVLYPLRDAIHPTALSDKLLAALGPSFLGPVAILRIWSFCLFYVMAELWGSVVISVLFWGCLYSVSASASHIANMLYSITTVEEAKEFYPLFGLGANIALIFSGRTVKYFSNLRKNLGPGVDGWAISLKGMMSIVVLLGFVICAIYWGVNTFVVNDPSLPRSDRKKKASNLFVKGKAAIDVVCNPLGKSGGALIQQFMILTFGSLANSTPYLGGILLVIVLAWLGAARSLDSQFSPLAKKELEKEKMREEKAKEPSIAADTDGLVAKEVKPRDNDSLHEPIASEDSTNGSPLKEKLASESESSSETSTGRSQ
ncbi:hypothetical protein BHE74_00012870 [Ensete ventricosum]|nr:hypothetical protein BHE74_00012870 [Ensete ventricosum]